ncbi:hypothetical protein XELAEV_18003930mg [Xenopus laevis]|nr:hypothetical protein XELAEV_18003930mg [Xenopus laevis]
MLSMFKNKGYLQAVLLKAEKEVNELPQETLLTIKKSENTSERIHFVTTFDIHSKQGTKTKLQGYFTCMLKNVIYYLKYQCGKGYVGKTNRMVRVQLNEHRSSIYNSQTKITSISQHWAECKHNEAQQRWQVLEEIKTNYVSIDKKLLQKECFWIWKLDT